MRNLVFAVLCFLVFVIPWSESASIPGAGTLIRYVGVLGIGLALLAIAVTGSMRRIPGPILLLAGFAVWSTLSLAWSLVPAETLVRSITYWMCLGFIWMVWEFATTPKRQRVLMHAFLWGCGVSLLDLYVAFIQGRGTGWLYLRYTGGGYGQAVLCLMAVLSIPMVVYVNSHPSKKFRPLRWIYWAYVPLACVGVFLTGARAGVVGLAIALGVTFLASYGGSWKTKAVFVFLVLLVAMLVPRVVPSTLLERLGEGMQATTFQSRVRSWGVGSAAFWKHPVTGVGSRALVGFSPPDGAPRDSTHNAYLNVLSENGLVGFLLYGGAWIWAVTGLWRLPGAERNLWLALLAAAGFMAGAEVIEHSKAMFFLMGLLVAQAEAFRAIRAWRRGLQWQFRRRLPAHG